ncbi:hypothetical protein [Brenneria tiliae]|uniref:Uncharacterized protein n=1 Tax=Brenneria tiliae TaxID=2914984 RepID=A0ABT0MTL4_9GAMM|nr:hypothetical protein [Brenneria tiliae]MCL2892534.1 hypothetical protein [Brenneria tiliae]
MAYRFIDHGRSPSRGQGGADRASSTLAKRNITFNGHMLRQDNNRFPLPPLKSRPPAIAVNIYIASLY